MRGKLSGRAARSCVLTCATSAPGHRATAVTQRTRLVVEMVKLVPYQTRVEGNNLFLVVGQEGVVPVADVDLDAARPLQDVCEIDARVLRHSGRASCRMRRLTSAQNFSPRVRQ